jgi:hypothetical protein
MGRREFLTNLNVPPPSFLLYPPCFLLKKLNRRERQEASLEFESCSFAFAWQPFGVSVAESIEAV